MILIFYDILHNISFKFVNSHFPLSINSRLFLEFDDLNIVLFIYLFILQNTPFNTSKCV